MHIDSTNLNKERKKLKRHYKEQDILDKIITHIKICKNYDELKNHIISKQYNFEKLKYNLGEYFSFNLNKKGGKIRLICRVNIEENKVKIEYISLNHYKDFKSRWENEKDKI